MGETCSACKPARFIEQSEIVCRSTQNSQHLAFTEQINDEEQMKEIPHTQASIKIQSIKSRIGEHENSSYLNLSNGGIVIKNFPNFESPIASSVKKNLGDFIFNRKQFEDPKATQKGPILFQSLYAYQGQWKGKNRSGRGIQIWVDGSIYEGYWKDNKAHGFGRLILASGDSYIGEWKNDKANGTGKYISVSGAQYSGQWKDDKQNGFGEEKWNDHTQYRGSYRQGKKQGFGILIYGKEKKYSGQFHDSKVHGVGHCTWSDGKSYEGEWKQNKMHGKGVLKWPDGRRYEGDFFNDQKHGFGVFRFSDGRIYEGSWQNGKQHGRGLYKRKNIIKEGIWDQGKRIEWVTSNQASLDIARAPAFA